MSEPQKFQMYGLFNRESNQLLNEYYASMRLWHRYAEALAYSRKLANFEPRRVEVIIRELPRRGNSNSGAGNES